MVCLSYAQLYAVLERVLGEARGEKSWSYQPPPSRLLTPNLPH